MTTEDASE